MKKILILVAICLCMCGCGKKYEVSELSWIKKLDSDWITGTIKNNTSKKCNILSIDLEYQSGSLKEKGLCSVHGLKANETKNFECLYIGNITNIKNYSIKLKNIECIA